MTLSWSQNGSAVQPTLRVDADGVKLGYLQRRRWWQLWKPKQWMQGLAEVAYSVHTNDRVSLLPVGLGYIVTVNDEKVLAWAPEPSRGWGFGSQNGSSS